MEDLNIKEEETIEISRLDIGVDYYAIAFCALLYKAQEQCPNLGEFDFVKYFYNVLFVVFMQATLLLLVGIEMLQTGTIT